jgi:Flp pilus assembly protein TadG
MTIRHRRRADRRGQALVEFSLVLIPFLVLLMGVLDLARGIYMLNGTAEAAREIARVTSVHPWNTPGDDLGSSAEAVDVVAIQRKLVPGLAITPSTDIVCVDVTDVVIPDSRCEDGDYIRVTVTAPFTPLTPVAKVFGDHTFSSVSRIQIP